MWSYINIHFCPAKLKEIAYLNYLVLSVAVAGQRDRVFHISGTDFVAPAWPDNAGSGRPLTRTSGKPGAGTRSGPRRPAKGQHFSSCQ